MTKLTRYDRLSLMASDIYAGKLAALQEGHGNSIQRRHKLMQASIDEAWELTAIVKQTMRRIDAEGKGGHNVKRG